MRFSLGKRNDILLGYIVHEVDPEGYRSLRAGHTHRFSERWSNNLGYSCSIGDGNKSHIVKEMVEFNPSPERRISTGLQWINREMEEADPSILNELSLLTYGGWGRWLVELEGHLLWEDETYFNPFFKVGYRREYLERYSITSYLSFGNRASQETSNIIEVGMTMEF